MPSSWDVYYVVFLSAVLALGIPAILALISFFVSPRRLVRSSRTVHLPSSVTGGKVLTPETNPFALSPVENRTVLGRRINTRFFLGVNAALALITLILALIPCAGMIQPSGTTLGMLLKGVMAIVSIAFLAMLGLLYAARKGDLSWVNSFPKNRRGDLP